jgi:hypothetical protein
VERARKLELLWDQLEAAQAVAADPFQLDAWREKTSTVLRITMGENHEQTSRFESINYKSRMPTNNPPYEVTVRQRGVDRARAVLEAAMFEVENDAPEVPPATEADEELWGAVGYLADAEQWGHLVSTAVVFFEHWTRTRAGFSNSLIGVDLMTAAYKPGGPLELAIEENPSEGEGWLLFAKGLTMAVRNVAGHRIEDRDDAQKYALGVVGAISLIMTQVRLEHPI